MRIDFGPERWDKLQETYKLWWQGKLNRPIIPIELNGKEVKRAKPDVPLLTQETCTDFSYTPEQIIDRLDYELSTKVYLGDAYPFFNLDVFGPGIMAAFLGAKVDNSTGRVWFHPQKEMPIDELHFELDPDNKWLNRIKEICQAGMKRWQGQVLIGMPDLGGVIDIISTFRPGEKLLLDLYDHPGEVKRLIQEVHDLWHQVYQDINQVLQPLNPGYSDWSSIYSEEPGYILQCDFCYMISPEMFAEFVKPELISSVEKLPRSFYHLDGPGQLNHLDSILDIEFDGIQWVPGDGSPDMSSWPEVYTQIYHAKKKIQVWGGLQIVEAVGEQIGDYRPINHHVFTLPLEKKEEVTDKLTEFGF